MPSNLRLQLDTHSTQSFYPKPASMSPPAKKQKMSLTQTYRVASTARGKLGREAARSDHDLRLLVGHANLLDSLMLELANAEREQEAWFNNTIRKADQAEQQSPKHIQWFDSITEEEEELSDSDSDSGSDVDTEDFPTYVTPRRRSISPPPPAPTSDPEFDLEDDSDDEDLENDDEHALTRVPSHTPELVHEESSDSEDDTMPLSPADSVMEADGQGHKDAQDYFQLVPPKFAPAPIVTDDFGQSNACQMVSAY